MPAGFRSSQISLSPSVAKQKAIQIASEVFDCAWQIDKMPSVWWEIPDYEKDNTIPGQDFRTQQDMIDAENKIARLVYYITVTQANIVAGTMGKAVIVILDANTGNKLFVGKTWP